MCHFQIDIPSIWLPNCKLSSAFLLLEAVLLFVLHPKHASVHVIPSLVLQLFGCDVDVSPLEPIIMHVNV